MDSLETRNTITAIRESITSLPRDLHGMYEQILKRINEQASDDAELAMKVLYWISCTLRPLSLLELQHGLAVRDNSRTLDLHNITDMEYIIDVCAGLVIVDENTKIVRLVHYTAQEYFEGVRVTQFPGAQAVIATGCLTYLLFDDFSEGYRSREEELKGLLERFPLLRYAAKYWGHHVREGQDSDLDRLSLKLLKSEQRLVLSLQVCFSDKPYAATLFPKFMPPLCVASYFGIEFVMRTLIDSGAKATAKTSSGENPVYIAAKYGHAGAVSLLLDNGGDIELQGGRYGTALHIAAARGHFETVQLLVSRGAGIETFGGHFGTALHAAASGGNEEIFNFLVRKGANIRAQGYAYGTVLHAACENGHESIVRLLLAMGCDINEVAFGKKHNSFFSRPANFSATPLVLACARGH